MIDALVEVSVLDKKEKVRGSRLNEVGSACKE